MLSRQLKILNGGSAAADGRLSRSIEGKNARGNTNESCEEKKRLYEGDELSIVKRHKVNSSIDRKRSE